MSKRPLAEILQFCHVEEVSGVLVLRNELVEKLVYLLDGLPAYVESDLRTETLGAYLVRSGKLSEAEHRMVFEQMRRTGKRQGELLVANGLLNPHELYEAMLAHIKEKIIACFGWEEGEYELEEGSEWSSDVLNLKLDPSRVILDGVARILELDRLEPVASLPDEARCFLRPDAPSALERLAITTSEARVYDLVSRGKTVGELVKSGRDDRLEVVRSLYGMYVLELVGFVTDKRSDPPEPGRLTPTPRRIADLEPEEPPVASKAQELIADYLNLKEKDYFELLDLERTATTDAINKAFHERLRKFRPEAVSDLPPTLRDQASELYQKLLTAHHVLSDPSKRLAYLESLQKSESTVSETGAADVLESDSLFEKALLDIDQERPADAAKKLRQALALKGGEPLYEAWLGWALYLSDPAKRRRTAERHLELARRAHPELPETYLFMARICEREGNASRAGDLYQMAIAKAPNDLKISREAHLFEVRRTKGRARRQDDQTREQPKSALDQDVGQLISRLFSKKR